MADNSSVRVVVWSDYVCPFCYLELPVIRRLQAEWGDRVVVDWRAFELRPEPIPTLDPDGPYLHRVWNESVYPMADERGMMLRLPPVQPRSRKAFQAVEAARAVGRFDAMHEALFRAFFEDGRDIGDTETLVEIGGSIGLDCDDLRTAITDGRHLAKILADEAEAAQRGVSAVPAIAIAPGVAPLEEGMILQGAIPYEVLQMTVERRGVIQLELAAQEPAPERTERDHPRQDIERRSGS